MSRTATPHTAVQQLTRQLLSNDTSLDVVPFSIARHVLSDAGNSARTEEHFVFPLDYAGRPCEISIKKSTFTSTSKQHDTYAVTVAGCKVLVADEKAAEVFTSVKRLYAQHSSAVLADVDQFVAALRDAHSAAPIPTLDRVSVYPPIWMGKRTAEDGTTSLTFEVTIKPSSLHEERAMVQTRIVGKCGQCRAEVHYDGVDGQAFAYLLVGEDEIRVTVAQLSGAFYERVQMYLEQPPVFGGTDILPLLLAARDIRADSRAGISVELRRLAIEAFSDWEIVEAFTTLLTTDVCGEAHSSGTSYPSDPYHDGVTAQGYHPITNDDILRMSEAEFRSLLTDSVRVYRAFDGLIGKRGAREMVSQGIECLRDFKGGPALSALVRQLKASPLAGACQLFESVCPGLSLTSSLPSQLPQGVLGEVLIGRADLRHFPLDAQTCEEVHQILDSFVWPEAGVRPLCRPSTYINFLLAVNEIPGLREALFERLRVEFSAVAQ